MRRYRSTRKGCLLNDHVHFLLGGDEIVGIRLLGRISHARDVGMLLRRGTSHDSPTVVGEKLDNVSSGGDPYPDGHKACLDAINSICACGKAVTSGGVL
jgi:hypothetical protein